MSLTNEQAKMVEDNLHIVNIVIKAHIRLNPNNCELAYDEMYQIGCLALCEAAMKFDESRGSEFFTFAYSIVKNSLMDQCRKVQKDLSCTTDDPEGIYEHQYSIKKHEAEIEDLMFREAFLSFSREAKRKYSGVVLKGIEAIEFKALGYTGSDIARLYGVKPNSVRAWISKARKELKHDPDIKAIFKD